MGKYDSMMRCAKARSLIGEKKYSEALEQIKDVPLEQVKVIADLNLIADVFIKNDIFDRALEVYQYLYGRVQTRRILYQLIFLSVKCEQMDEAEEYYKQYIALPAQSSDRLILKYFLDKGRGRGRRQLIADLEELKKEDYIEEWAYELAKLYHKEGMEKECVEECGDIIMWFGEGKIVEKAMLLKLHYEDGLDISSPKAIEETRNLAADLKLAAALAARHDREYSRSEGEEDEVLEAPVSIEGENKRAKLLELFEAIGEHGELPHFALIGEEKDKVTEFAKTISKGLAAKKVTAAAKLARISSSRLNEINLEDKLAQLRGGCLLISDAGKLSINSLQSLNKILQENENGIVAILADKEDGLESVLRRNKKLQSIIKFEIRV